MKKIFRILKGWGKATGILSTSTAEKKLSALRLTICMRCEHSKSSKVLEILNGQANYENRLKCDKCKCPCLEKSLVTDEKCPIAKW